MLIQYGSNVVVALLMALHALRQRRGKGFSVAHLIPRVRALNALTADARILFRIWGLLPMLKWMLSLAHHPPPSRNLRLIERLQALSMVVYAPMEAAAYEAMHKILPSSPASQNFLWLNGCRLWAAYVLLDFWHVVEDNRLLRTNAKALEKSRGHPSPHDSEKALSEEQQTTRRMWSELRQRKDMLLSQFWVNVGYLPLTMHWSVEGGLITDGWVGVFGTIAAVASTRMQWKATA